jgi:transposase
MDALLNGLDCNYQVDDLIIKDSAAVFKISSKLHEIECTFCGQKSNKIHSKYEREIQDLPLLDKKTILLIQTRKFFCINPDCGKRTFAERHPFVAPNGKKTDRLEQSIISTATNLSSINASRVLQSSNISASKSSICELLKKNASKCG